jgi:hypothetical protein
MIKWSFRIYFLSLIFLLLSSTTDAQIIPRKDTIQRDIGVSINWRSLPFLPSSNKVSDIVGGFHLAFEVRAHNFWIQTGVLVNWNSANEFDKKHDILISLSTPYEFAILKNRLILGVGPIASYHYTYEKQLTTETLEVLYKSSVQHSISMGVNFEITVPIWKGLSIETCSDIGPGVAFTKGGKGNLVIATTRLLSLGINYRITAYPK